MTNGLKLRNFIYKSLYKIDTLLSRKSKLIIICFHSVNDESTWRHSIPQKTFEEQINYLNGAFEVIDPNDIGRLFALNDAGKAKALITFDDGYLDNLHAMNILNKYNIKPVIFILSGAEKEISRNEMQNDLPLLTDEDVLRLLDNGWALGSHGHTHKNLIFLNGDDLTQEISDSKKILENKFSTAIKFFSYPKGNYNNEIINKVKEAGYEFAFSMNDSANFENKFIIPRIGIDSSHDAELFKATISPSVIQFRSFLKFILPKKFIELFL